MSSKTSNEFYKIEDMCNREIIEYVHTQTLS